MIEKNCDATLSPKRGPKRSLSSDTKKIIKSYNKFLLFFSLKVFLSTWNDSIHLIWPRDEKIMDNLFFEQFKHPLEKITNRHHF